MKELESYVQDALDLDELANGSTDSKRKKIRKDMGRPDPFNLKFIGIGNEQWDLSTSNSLMNLKKPSRKKILKSRLFQVAAFSKWSTL